MTKNEDFRYLCVDLPGDIARRKAAGDLSGALRLVEARLAGDCEPELAARFGVMSIPTVVLFENGQEKNRSVGLVPKEKLLALLGR